MRLLFPMQTALAVLALVALGPSVSLADAEKQPGDPATAGKKFRAKYRALGDRPYYPPAELGKRK